MRLLNKTAVLGAALLVVAITGRADDAGQVKNDFFTISLPAGFSPFATQAQTAKAPDGKPIETTNWVSKSPSGEAIVVTVSKMPGKILDADKLINSTRDSLLKTLKATLESEDKQAGAVPATRVLFHSDAAFFRSRFVVSDDKFYQLLYVGRTADQRSAPAVGQLFDSFTIANAPAQQAAATAPAH